MADDLQAQISDVRLELEKLRGELMTECTKLAGDVKNLAVQLEDHAVRTTSLEDSSGAGTQEILRAIRETQPPSANGTRAKNAGMVAAGGGLGAGILKIAEWLLQ